MPELGFDTARMRAAFAGRRVLLTGHSGFKGGWMALWLHSLGADVVGIALPPPTDPSLHDSIGLDELIDGRMGDIRCERAFAEALAGFDAELVIHMAAAAIVRQCHASPIDTYRTNVVGTAVVLDAVRTMPSCRAVVVVTSDKCYDNREWPWGYRESDPLGGADPYSSSKAGTELVANAYRQSFFGGGGPLLATVRAGNVFGGGDWAPDRLVPDIIRATLAGVPTLIRNPGATRPWQHVLEPLAGYLLVAEALLQGREAAATGWNFGPDADGTIDVARLAALMGEAWGPVGGPEFRMGEAAGPREAGLLALDSAKARTLMGWKPRLALAEALEWTIDWYRHWAAGDTDMRAFTLAQIARWEAKGERVAEPRGSGRQLGRQTGDIQQCA